MKNLAVVIGGVQDGVELDALNDWLANNGLRHAGWWVADTLMVIDGHVIGSRFVNDDVPVETPLPPSLRDPATGGRAIMDVRVPLQVFPSPNLIKSDAKIGDTNA